MNKPHDDPFILAKEVGSILHNRDVASQHLGITLEEIGAGYAEMRMTVKEWMLQGHNICHGGLIFSLADTAMAFASNSRNKTNLAMTANIDFLRPAHAGDQLKAIAIEGDKTRKTGMYDVKVYGENDELICHFRGRTYVKEKEVI